jgi:hypothetical protein
MTLKLREFLLKLRNLVSNEKKKTTQPSINPEIISQTTKLKLLLLQNKIKEELKQL